MLGGAVENKETKTVLFNIIKVASRKEKTIRSREKGLVVWRYKGIRSSSSTA